MQPSIALTGPGEVFLLAEPKYIIMNVKERLIFFSKDLFQLHRINITNPHKVCILGPVQLLDHYFMRLWYKVHSRKVMIA